jgi:hypothetical protein
MTRSVHIDFHSVFSRVPNATTGHDRIIATNHNEVATHPGAGRHHSTTHRHSSRVEGPQGSQYSSIRAYQCPGSRNAGMPVSDSLRCPGVDWYAEGGFWANAKHDFMWRRWIARRIRETENQNDPTNDRFQDP